MRYGLITYIIKPFLSLRKKYDFCVKCSSLIATEKKMGLSVLFFHCILVSFKYQFSLGILIQLSKVACFKICVESSVIYTTI